MTSFEIPTLLLAPALPFRRICFFKVGSFFPFDFDFGCTCSSRSAGKTVGLVHIIGHASAPSLSQSHCGLERCFHFVHESLQMPQNSRIISFLAQISGNMIGRNLLELFVRSRKYEHLYVTVDCALNNSRKILLKGSTLSWGCLFWSKKLHF